MACATSLFKRISRPRSLLRYWLFQREADITKGALTRAFPYLGKADALAVNHLLPAVAELIVRHRRCSRFCPTIPANRIRLLWLIQFYNIPWNTVRSAFFVHALIVCILADCAHNALHKTAALDNRSAIIYRHPIIAPPMIENQGDKDRVEINPLRPNRSTMLSIVLSQRQLWEW